MLKYKINDNLIKCIINRIKIRIINLCINLFKYIMIINNLIGMIKLNLITKNKLNIKILIN